MGLVLTALFFLCVGWVLGQLRLRGCLFWLLWMGYGAAIVYVLLLFRTGVWRV